MRKFLVSVTAVFAVVGIGVVLYLFISMLGPGANVLSRDDIIRIDVSEIPEGKAKLIEWNSLPVIILHRTKEQLKQLPELNGYRVKDHLVATIADDERLIPEYRSIKPEYFVVYGWTGNAIQCGSNYTPKLDNYPSVKGGFSEMCRGAWHDVTGRLLKGGWQEGGDLPIPPYEFVNKATIKIGPPKGYVLEKWR